jgi:hypothetical protein
MPERRTRGRTAIRYRANSSDDRQKPPAGGEMNAAGLVGEAGLEPAISCSQSTCVTRLRYSPPIRAQIPNDNGRAAGGAGLRRRQRTGQMT